MVAIAPIDCQWDKKHHWTSCRLFRWCSYRDSVSILDIWSRCFWLARFYFLTLSSLIFISCSLCCFLLSYSVQNHMVLFVGIFWFLALFFLLSSNISSFTVRECFPLIQSTQWTLCLQFEFHRGASSPRVYCEARIEIQTWSSFGCYNFNSIFDLLLCTFSFFFAKSIVSSPTLWWQIVWNSKIEIACHNR